MLKPLDVVQTVMIELHPQRLDHPLDLAVVDQVVLTLGNVAFDKDIDSKRVAVHTPALVAFGKRRQEMSRFKGKRFRKTDMHEN